MQKTIYEKEWQYSLYEEDDVLKFYVYLGGIAEIIRVISFDTEDWQSYQIRGVEYLETLYSKLCILKSAEYNKRIQKGQKII